MKLKEKILRNLNAEVQKCASISPEGKLFCQNAVLALDITHMLVDLTSDSDTSLSVCQAVNEKLRRIMEVLES